MTVNIPEIEQPYFAFGDSGKGIGRGPGKEGDVVGRDPQPGQGKGNKAGDSPGEGIDIQVDLEDVLKLMEEDLKLPRMKPKPNETFEEIKIKYNDISKTGPESLRHTRRTMLEAIKRLAMMGTLDQLQMIPGCQVPLRMITPINSDRRYRQYREIRIPTSNAVIFFARDCSGSMDEFRCEIVSDMAWWIDCWIRRFYKRVDRCYFVHDTRAQEVDEEKFYTYRYGGGTMCSSAFKAISEQLVNRYPPTAFNVYVFYFSDGENWGGDNDRMLQIIKEELGPSVVNMIGMAQVCSWSYEGSVKHFLDQQIKGGNLQQDYFRTAYVGPKNTGPTSAGFANWGYRPEMNEDDRNEQIIDAVRTLLAADQNKYGAGSAA